MVSPNRSLASISRVHNVCFEFAQPLLRDKLKISDVASFRIFSENNCRWWKTIVFGAGIAESSNSEYSALTELLWEAVMRPVC